MAIAPGLWSYSPISFGKPAFGNALIKKGALSDNSFTYWLIDIAPKAQLKPILNKGIWEIEFKKASVVCPERVLPLSSVIVPDTIIGNLFPIFSKTSSIPNNAALQFRVSKTVSTKSKSTPPSINPKACSL